MDMAGNVQNLHVGCRVEEKFAPFSEVGEEEMVNHLLMKKMIQLRGCYLELGCKSCLPAKKGHPVSGEIQFF